MKRHYYYVTTVVIMTGIIMGAFRIHAYLTRESEVEMNSGAEHGKLVEAVVDRQFTEGTRRKFQKAIQNPQGQDTAQEQANPAPVAVPANRPLPQEARAPLESVLTESQERLRENTLTEFAVFRERAVRDPLSIENLETREALVHMHQGRDARRREAEESANPPTP